MLCLGSCNQSNDFIDAGCLPEPDGALIDGEINITFITNEDFDEVVLFYGEDTYPLSLVKPEGREYVYTNWQTIPSLSIDKVITRTATEEYEVVSLIKSPDPIVTNRVLMYLYLQTEMGGDKMLNAGIHEYHECKD